MMVVWVTLAVLLVCGGFGWRAGVIKRVIELAGVVVSVVVTARFASSVAPWVDQHTGLDVAGALVLAHILMFVAALVLVRVIASMVSKFVHWTPLGWLDKLGGALCGVLLGALVVSVGLIAVSRAPGGEKVREAYTENPVGDVIYHAAPAIYQGAHKLLGGKVDSLWHDAVEVGREVKDEAEDKAREVLEDR